MEFSYYLANFAVACVVTGTGHADTGNEIIPKIIINNTIINLCFKTAVGILVVSNRNSLRVLLDKIAPVYFV